MTNNDIDVDTQDDFDKEVPARPSLKETWDSNPLLKIAAVVLVGAIVVGGFMTFMGDEKKDEDRSIVQGMDFKTVTAAPGTTETDEEYKKAQADQNKQIAEQAEKTGGSAIPTVIGTVSDTGLKLPDGAKQNDAEDPLTQWRRRTEVSRVEMENKIAEEDDGAPAADVVPVVTPIRPQANSKMDQKAAQRLTQQMRAIIAAQAPQKAIHKQVTKIDSEYVQMLEEDKKLADEMKKMQSGSKKSSGSGSSDANKKPSKKVIVPAGAIVYAQLMNELNSDIKSPALVQIASGPFAGGRALGEFKMNDEYLTLTFNKIIKDGVMYSVNGIALDEQTTLAAHQTSVDHHYFTRVILPAAAKFIEGYSAAVAERSTTTTTTSGGGVVASTPAPSAKEEMMSGAKESAKVLSDIMSEQADVPITVHLSRGTTMGILFLDNIDTSDAAK